MLDSETSSRTPVIPVTAAVVVNWSLVKKRNSKKAKIIRKNRSGYKNDFSLIRKKMISKNHIARK